MRRLTNYKMRIKLLIVLTFFLSHCAPRQTEEKGWNKLFNDQDLSGWDTYLGPFYDTMKNQWSRDHVGLNKDPLRVFDVVKVDETSCLRISGEHFGGISTTEEFENYHLRLEFKWGEARWAPKKNSKRDSGVLYHAVGKHGVDGGFWMRSQEFQVQEGDNGDYWGVAGGSFDVKATKVDSAEYVYDPGGSLMTFNEKSPNGRRCIRLKDFENEHGKWNTVEIYCLGGTAVHLINSRVVMILQNSSQIDAGVLTPLTKGKIQIQSEGAEVFYRKIEIRPIGSIPAEILTSSQL